MITEHEPGGFRDRCGRCGGWISLGHARGSDCEREQNDAEPTRHTAKEKLEAIERELKYRERVYERRVADGQMTRRLADYQISVFRDILRDYIAPAQKERLI